MRTCFMKREERNPGDTQPGLGGFKDMGMTTNPERKKALGGGGGEAASMLDDLIYR